MADVVPGGEAAVKAGVKSAKSVPPMVWIIAVVGGLAVSFYLSKRSGGGSGSGGEDGVPFAVTYTGTGGGNNTGNGTSVPGSSAPKSNEDWANLAKTYLIARGNPSKSVDEAVNKYLAGYSLTAQENALIALAITGVGPTPQPLSPGGGNGGDTLAPITNLRVTSQTKTHIGLAWDPVPGVVQYMISTPGVTNVRNSVFDYSTIPAYTSGPWPPGSTFEFEVHGMTLTGENTASAKITAKTEAA